MLTINFDSQTKWPNQDKLPTGFNPEKILEDSKNPGLGIKKLHEQGITGQGVSVAIIDQCLDINHLEYARKISSYDAIVMLQVNQNLKEDQLFEIIKQTAKENNSGLKIINPVQVVEEVKKLNKR